MKEWTAVIPIISLVIIFLALFYFGDELGFDTDIDVDFLQVLPGLVGVVIGLALFALTRGTYAFPSLMLVGFALAFLFGTLDDMGMITTELKVGLTIEQIQLWIIVLFGLTGGVVNAMVLRR